MMRGRERGAGDRATPDVHRRVGTLFLIALSLASAGCSVLLTRDDEARFWRLQTGGPFPTVVDEVCAMHGVTTELREVPVVHGLCVKDRRYMWAKLRRFPNSFLFVNSCSCEPVGESTVFRRVCPACRAAEAKWQGGERHRE